MEIFTFGRYAICVGTCAAMLAACGGSALGPSIAPGPSTALGVTRAERAHSVGTYSLLYSFGNGSGDGQSPYAGLINVKGTLYGTTAYGATEGTGIVFAVTTTGTETVVHRFGGSGDGQNPFAQLLDVKGTLYGTTFGGGTHSFGTVFSISNSGKETVLHSFGTGGDGDWPEAGVTNVKGTLYGTTSEGGVFSAGTVFAITKTGTETVLHPFAGGTGDGAVPYDGLLNLKGTLYGTTEYGGTADAGTVFAMSASGTVTILHSFGVAAGDGGYPLAGLVNVNGTLYGTTVIGGASCGSYHITGCGVVFSIMPSGKETVLHSFGRSGDGVYPYAGLTNIKGTLYGTTAAGGSNCSPFGCGVVFSLTRSGKETVLHSFGATGDGAYSGASLLDVKGTLYGTTVNGGANNYGTVFSLKP